MRKRPLAVLAGFTAISMLLAACGGGGGSKGAIPTGQSPSQVSAPYSGPAALANFTWGQSLMQSATYVGPATTTDENTGISMQVAVQMQNAAGLIQYSQEASDPGSGSYRQFLTPQQIGAEYGATDANYQAVFTYFQGYGISVGGWPQKMMVSLSGTVNQFEQAFGTKYAWYELAGTTFLGPSTAPHTSAVVPISGVVHMAQYTIAQNFLIRLSAANFWGLSPQQIAHAFDYTGAWSAGYNGAGINAGIIGTGPILTGAAGDVAHYSALFNNAPVANVTMVSALAQAASAQNNQTGSSPFDPNPGGLTTPPAATTTTCRQTSPPNYVTCNPEDGEAQLDQEQVAGMAPGANVLFYLAYNPAVCENTTSGNLQSPAPSGACSSGTVQYPLEGIDLTDDEIQQAIADNAADTVSMSFGEDEAAALAGGYFNSSGVGPGTAEIAALSAEGIAVFISSGDNGSDACQNVTSGAVIAGYCVSYPASDPSAVSVGGVNVPVDNAGNVVGEITAWGDETTAGGNGRFSNNIGSGGGISKVFTTPTFQSGVTSLPPGNPPLGGFRGVPDMSLLADPDTGPSLSLNSGGSWVAGASGGTSAAAPEASAMWAVVLSACKKSSACSTAGGAHAYRLGNPNPLLYKIASAAGYRGSTYSQVIYDVLYGNNDAVAPRAGSSPTPLQGSCCYAGAGYDLVTGLGVPYARHLINALVSGVSNVP